MSQGKISLTPGNLQAIAKNCIAEQQARLEQNNQQVICLSEKTNSEAVFDVAQIGQVITNFLSNAIKFAPEGSHIEFTIEDSKLESFNQEIPGLLFSVRDHGKGIPDGELELVFDQFAQSSDTSVATTKGTGLGLPISKEIIDLHHGKIWAENHSEEGAVFSFIVPVNPSNIPTPRRRKGD